MPENQGQPRGFSAPGPPLGVFLPACESNSETEREVRAGLRRSRPKRRIGRGSSVRPLGEPRLKHQNVPQRVVRIPIPRQVFVPRLPDGSWLKVTFLSKASLLQKLFGPPPQRATQPIVDWDTESLLRSLDQRFGDVLVKDLAQNPLTAAVPDFHGQRELPCKLHDSVVQERHARLEGNRHAGAVDFHQDLVGQEAQHVEQHHSVDEVGRLDQESPSPSTPSSARRSPAPARPGPAMRKQIAIGDIRRLFAENLSELVELLAVHPTPDPLREERTKDRQSSIPRPLRKSPSAPHCWPCGASRAWAAPRPYTLSCTGSDRSRRTTRLRRRRRGRP